MKQIRSEKAGVIGLAILFCILAIGAIGSKLYVDSAKMPPQDRSRAVPGAVYSWDDFQPSLDRILKARGETK